MLFNKDILAQLDQKLKIVAPHFNIQIILQMLQNTTRPLGYPSYPEGVNNEFYFDLLNQKITAARTTNNSRQFQLLMTSLYQMMICFCYLQHTLGINKIDDELLSLLFSSINERFETTDEERCAEKSLLASLVQKIPQLLEIIAEHHEYLTFVNMPQRVQEQLTCCGNKRLKQLVSTIADTAALGVTVHDVSEVLNLFTEVDEALNYVAPYTDSFSKKRCQIIIGLYLLNQDNQDCESSINTPFLKTARRAALQEKGKEEVTSYISLRKKENDYFGSFRTYSKEIKLNSAHKFFKVLNNERAVIFSPRERDALQHDTDSRLTDLYLRYKHIIKGS